MRTYESDPEWADIQPIPQNDTGRPLAAIAYTDAYSEAMSYLRAVMAANEYSKRALALTEHIIGMNPAHYTVWLYRARILFALHTPLSEEIAWLNPTALRHLKNYQIWHHRQTIIDKLGSSQGEPEFIAQMLKADAKNYHVWSYRQWLVKRFGLFGDEGELRWTEGMIGEDVRNNSAWNHRFYVVFAEQEVGEEVVEREIKYAQSSIAKAPQNQSPWNYLRGVLRHAKMPISSIKEFALQYADLEHPDKVLSSYALDVLADVFVEEKNVGDARRALELLETTFDPIRAQYWNYRKVGLGEGGAAAAA